MKPKTQDCEFCASFNWPEDHKRPQCLRGHRLRYYQPRNELDYAYGWKRRCADYLRDETRIKYFLSRPLP